VSEWEACRVESADPGGRITVDPAGASFVRILSPSFRLNDGDDYTYVGWGNRLIFNGVESSDPLVPDAPVLTAVDVVSNPPTLDADFDDDACWAAGDIDGSNYDRIYFEWSQAADFTGASTANDTLDATELLAGEVSLTTGPLATGDWYMRVRHDHVVAGASHLSAWSNTVTWTYAFVSDAIELEGSTDLIELEGSTDYILLEAA